MARVCEKLGSQVLPRVLEDIGLENTQQYDPYEDETQNDHTSPQVAQELEPMPKVGDHYIEAEILLPSGDEVVRGHDVAWSCNANENVMQRANTNAILDIRMYQVEFAGDNVTESTANIISEIMDAQCDVDRSKYLLLDSIMIIANRTR